MVIILSTVLEYFLVTFLATSEVLVPLANDPIMLGSLIWSFRHLEHQYPSIISDSIDRARMVQQFWSNGIEWSTVG